MCARLFLPVVICAVLPPAGLGFPCDEPERVKVTVVVILANDRDATVHPKLECLARELRKKHPKLTGFGMGQTTSKSLAAHAAGTFPLIDGREAVIAVKRCSENPDRFCLKVKSPALVGEIVYSAACGKYMPFDTGYISKKGRDQVFLAVMVEPCPGRKK